MALRATAVGAVIEMATHAVGLGDRLEVADEFRAIEMIECGGVALIFIHRVAARAVSQLRLSQMRTM